ncbi:NAD(P)H-quinone oxidoreductase subunit F [Leptothermofonsia sichuanensis E412]|uniref:NAD(P)H-quinone oxidoreductase subunit F n=1 Tax=Leptothermofonsia sichuanensis TaxID=2917832 RepID=UPI001CA72C4B|nr:NAD(P)H-quinone oxidoreductase subunit F [Leptothermofonsia sichuanensis]QZZ19026.1 NAD(P)H-quinone oxidoreductase subunit F [Leptothermofonsia sichuanensis E412]
MTSFFAETFWLIPCYPLVGMLLTLPWSPGIIRRTGPRPAGYVNLLTTFLALLHGTFAFPAVWQQPPHYLEISWLQVAGLHLTIPLEVSALTIGATTLVTGMNFLAQIYAVGYLEMDWGWARFFALLALFEAGMCSLILCNSLFFSYMLLEILTLGTYLLVGFWLNQSLVVTGARDAFLTKRVGDLFLLMGVLALYPLAGTWDFNELAQWAETAELQPVTATLLGLALIAGPMGKCAQFPLHLWLDEAMEGPIPSTILRNSVVVATGAWVLIRLEPVLALSPVVLITMIAIGSVTAIGGALISMAQIDIKRSLSYTVSTYMGLIFIAVGTGHTGAALLLILSHALAQGLLIMSTGSIVLNSITQDLTQLGGLWSRRPISGICYLVGMAGLIGLPPLGGFWALLKLADGLWTSHPWLLSVLLLVNGLTAFSMMREFGLIFAGQPKQMTERSPENFWLVTLPMMVLMGFALHLPLILQSLSLLPSWATLNKDVALLLLWSSLAGCGIGAIVYVGQMIPKPIQLPWRQLQNFFAYDLYTPTLYRSSIVFSVDWASRITDWFDRFIIDGVVNLVGLASLFSGEALKYGNTGQSQFYILTIALGSVAIAIAMSWSFISSLFLTFTGH